jgi:hypothetical protein
MERYQIPATEETPAIILDKSNNIYSIIGRSLPEDVVSFYKPTLDWFAQYSENPSPDINLDVKLEYFNTASSKLLLDILMKLDDIAADKGCNISINWHYDEKDQDMLEAGEEYSELVSLTFNMISF